MVLYHILKTQQFKEDRVLQQLFSLTDKMKLLDKYPLTDREKKICSDLILSQEPRKKLMACLFYEPSTRTRFSFESAMKGLGGETISTESAGMFSSAAKGETLQDTARVVSKYADVIVIRHKEKGAAEKAAASSSVPIINAGDGSGQHPTQALLDLYTINEELGKIDGVHLATVGDGRNGRTIRSLAYLLAHRKNIKIDFISPEPLAIKPDIRRYLQKKNVSFREIFDKRKLEKVVRECDVLYVTRIQKERFDNPAEYEKCKGQYIINAELANLMKPHAIIMHPLPRVDEIDTDVDTNSRAVYFKQAENGKYVRMALLKMILDPKRD